ncbi:uncharacterized protein N7477_005225 [Penicillium maclennaniae]|uniref:uncharacterized protein n=1 Tax=Penicillium maclennaniae TaxID=1343394 RepID=UPI00254038C6|nr:uncharacterized protein N7477_005225 [Penicillium maclennaniae]KAJ5675291.1 hypothetical protein N7477_005225 [Penicillium maclennaniae]
MVQLSKFLAVAAVYLAAPAIAHPGEQHDPHMVKRGIHARDAMAAAAKTSLEACENSLHARELAKHNIARRARTVQQLRKERGITTTSQKWTRNLAALEKWEAVNHNKTDILNYSPATPESVVFAANTSCILTPIVTDEELYSDGVDTFLEVQYIDINTCRPVPGALVDIWQANATGVYSGISESGNYAAGGWDSTYLRGIQLTDKDGVASFETIFPGHYEGRATHTHLLTHVGAKLLPNKTLEVGTGSMAHIGQLHHFKRRDMWSIEQADSAYDPFPEYIYLGESLDDGLFAWIQIGINATADYTDNSYDSIAAYHDANGGHENSDSSVMGGAPSGTNSSMPSGSFSVGASASSSA